MQIFESGMQISKISERTYFSAFEKWDSQVFKIYFVCIYF
jgi:hypothetical protein